MEITALDLVQRYQGLVAAIIGFGGIIVTLIVNAWLTRKQAQYNVDREAAGLRRALEAELGVISKSLQASVNAIQEALTDGSTSILVPLTELTSIFDASTSRLGLLDRDQIGALVKSYALVKELPVRIRLLSKAHAPDPSARYIPVGSPLFQALADLHSMVLIEVDGTKSLLASSRIVA